MVFVSDVSLAPEQRAPLEVQSCNKCRALLKIYVEWFEWLMRLCGQQFWSTKSSLSQGFISDLVGRASRWNC